MNHDTMAAYRALVVMLKIIAAYLEVERTRINRLAILHKRQADDIGQMLELMKKAVPGIGRTSFADEICDLLTRFANNYEDLQDNLRAMAGDVEGLKEGLQDGRKAFVGE